MMASGAIILPRPPPVPSLQALKPPPDPSTASTLNLRREPPPLLPCLSTRRSLLLPLLVGAQGVEEVFLQILLVRMPNPQGRPPSTSSSTARLFRSPLLLLVSSLRPILALVLLLAQGPLLSLSDVALDLGLGPLSRHEGTLCTLRAPAVRDLQAMDAVDMHPGTTGQANEHFRHEAGAVASQTTAGGCDRCPVKKWEKFRIEKALEPSQVILGPPQGRHQAQETRPPTQNNVRPVDIWGSIHTQSEMRVVWEAPQEPKQLQAGLNLAKNEEEQRHEQAEREEGGKGDTLGAEGEQCHDELIGLHFVEARRDVYVRFEGIGREKGEKEEKDSNLPGGILTDFHIDGKNKPSHAENTA